VDTTNEEGWVKLHRKILSNPVFQDSEALQLFIYCLLKANHKPANILFNQQIVALERGQFIFGLHQACKDLKMSMRKLRNRLLILGKLEITAIKTTNKFSIITVCNYSQYQDSKNEKGQTKGQTDDKQTTTNKNVKNEKNYIGRSKKDTDPRVKEFEEYWGKTFQEQTGYSYLFSFGKDGSLIKHLLAVHDLPTLQDATKAFFKDEQCKRRGLTIGIFFQEISRLLGQKGMNPLEQARRESARTRVSEVKQSLKTFQRGPVEQIKGILESGGVD